MSRYAFLVPALVAALALFSWGCSGCNNNADMGAGNRSDGGPDGGGDGGADGGDGGTQQVGVGPGGFTLDGGPDGTGDGVKFGPDGGLVLDSNDIRLHFAWIANVSAGTVSKFDTKTGNEVARYYSVIPVDGLGAANGLRGNNVNQPSRTAIDLNGDVWVANRATGIQGSVTKIANDLASCRHSLPDGGTNTSMDLNNDGQIDTNPAAGEFIRPNDFTNPAQYDDCVLFSTPVGSLGSGVAARALGISAAQLEGTASAGDIWVGIWRDRTILKLSSINGQQVPVGPDAGMQINLPSWGPYGMAVDSQQRLWVAGAPGDITAASVALVDTATGNLVNGNIRATGIGTTSDYGIAIDGKDRVWLASWNSGASTYRYDHGPGLDAGVGTWTRFDFTGAVSQTGSSLGHTRGIAADDQGYIWSSGHKLVGTSTLVAQLIGFNAEDGGILQFRFPDAGTADFIDATGGGTSESIGVGLDSDNNIWVNNYSGNAMKINRDGGTVFLTPNQGGNLYTYSDFTGYQLRHFTARRGIYYHDFLGCSLTTTWGPVTWSAVTPPYTSISLYVTVADSLSALNNTALTQYGPFTTSPASLSNVPRAAAMRVKFVLSNTDNRSTPILNGFNVSYSCSGLN